MGDSGLPEWTPSAPLNSTLRLHLIKARKAAYKDDKDQCFVETKPRTTSLVSELWLASGQGNQHKMCPETSAI